MYQKYKNKFITSRPMFHVNALIVSLFRFYIQTIGGKQKLYNNFFVPYASGLLYVVTLVILLLLLGL